MPLRRGLCRQVLHSSHSLVLGRRLQHNSGMKRVSSALLLLNISFSLYWLTPLPQWAISLSDQPRDPPSSQILGAVVVPFPLNCALFVSSEFFSPPSLIMRPWWLKTPGSPCSRQAWWSSMRLFAIRAELEPKYSPQVLSSSLSSQKLYFNVSRHFFVY